MLSKEERRGYRALIALGALLGIVVGMIALDVVVDRDETIALFVVPASMVLAMLVCRPLARREAGVWADRRRRRDTA